MPKFVPICLSLLILATCLPVDRALRTVVEVGNLIDHLEHHLTHDGGHAGLLELVDLHYGDNDHHEADHEEHEHLPFQHHHGQDLSSPAGLRAFVVPDFFLPPARHLVERSNTPLIPRELHWHTSSYGGDIWQPPRA